MTDRVVVGRVGRPHGLDGSFVVEGASEDPRWFKVGREAARRRRRAGGRRRAARRRPARDPGHGRGAARRDLEVPREALPPTGEDEYYTFQLVGLEVVEEASGRSAASPRCVPGVANDSLELDSGALLPLVGDCVLNIDLETGRILVAPGFSDPD